MHLFRSVTMDFHSNVCFGSSPWPYCSAFCDYWCSLKHDGAHAKKPSRLLGFSSKVFTADRGPKPFGRPFATCPQKRCDFEANPTASNDNIIST